MQSFNDMKNMIISYNLLDFHSELLCGQSDMLWTHTMECDAGLIPVGKEYSY